jgi:hypothetical protein
MSSKKNLLHILSVNRTKFQIPGGKFRVALNELTDDAESKIKKYKKDFEKKQAKLRSVPLNISPFSIGLYNAVVDVGSPIDIASILSKVKEFGLVSENGIKVTKFKMRYGRFQTALEYTSEYGLVGNETKPFVSADFQIKITKDGETVGASFSYYKSGKVRFSGGHVSDIGKEPKELVKFFSKHYYRIPASADIEFNNVTSEFKLGFHLKKEIISELFTDKELSGFKVGDREYKVVAKYEELPDKRKKTGRERVTKFLYITFSVDANKSLGFSLIVSNNGIIQIQGTQDYEHAYDISKKFFEALKDNDFMVIPENRSQNTSLAKPKNTKVVRRMNNKPAPNVTRRGTTCPLARRPGPYSYEGTCSAALGPCYIKPNPQGQPCCYAIPKSKEYSRNKVANAYKKAGVKVPAIVRREFGIGLNTNNKPVNVAKKNTPLVLKTSFSRETGFKIGTRQCSRYTKVGLVDIATRLKIVLPTKLTKPILCKLIQQASNNNGGSSSSRSSSRSPPKKRRNLSNINSGSSSSRSSSRSPPKKIRNLSNINSGSSPKKMKFKNNEALYNYIEQFGGQRSPPKQKTQMQKDYEQGLAGGFKMNTVRKRHVQSAFNGLKA